MLAHTIWKFKGKAFGTIAQITSVTLFQSLSLVMRQNSLKVLYRKGFLVKQLLYSLLMRVESLWISKLNQPVPLIFQRPRFLR